MRYPIQRQQAEGTRHHVMREMLYQALAGEGENTLMLEDSDGLGMVTVYEKRGAEGVEYVPIVEENPGKGRTVHEEGIALVTVDINKAWARRAGYASVREWREAHGKPVTRKTAKEWAQDVDTWTPYVDSLAVDKAATFDQEALESLSVTEARHLIRRLADMDDPWSTEEYRQLSEDGAVDPDNPNISSRLSRWLKLPPATRRRLKDAVQLVREYDNVRAS